MTDLREEIARAIAKEIGDGFDNAFADKGEWIDERGEKAGRYRDVNEPFQGDYRAAAAAALAAIEAAGFVVVPREATEEMMAAYQAEYRRGNFIGKILGQRRWVAMLAAAPKP